MSGETLFVMALPIEPMPKDIGLDLVHVATDEGMLPHGQTLFIWCWGSCGAQAWRVLNNDATPTCMACLARGPRSEWTQRGMFGVPQRQTMIDGKPFLELDTETK